MAKYNSKAKKSGRRNRRDSAIGSETVDRIPKAKSATLRAEQAWIRHQAKPLICQTLAQEHYLSFLKTQDITCAFGPAGTGKTYVSVTYASQALDNREVESIIVVRPCVESGNGLGFLAGKLSDKTEPYQNPFMEVFEQYYGSSHLDNLINGPHPRIRFVAPQYIRGRTFRNAIVILDEAQNLDCDQMETFLTRIGDGAKYVIQGDLNQLDIKDKRTGKKLRSGLQDAIEILNGISGVGIVTFREEDIVRSGLCREIAIRYRDRRQSVK